MSIRDLEAVNIRFAVEGAAKISDQSLMDDPA